MIQQKRDKAEAVINAFVAVKNKEFNENTGYTIGYLSAMLAEVVTRLDDDAYKMKIDQLYDATLKSFLKV